MAILKKRPEDTTKILKVKIQEELLNEIEEISNQANSAGADFPIDEIIESALKKAVKKAKSELQELRESTSDNVSEIPSKAQAASGA